MMLYVCMTSRARFLLIAYRPHMSSQELLTTIWQSVSKSEPALTFDSSSKSLLSLIGSPTVVPAVRSPAPPAAAPVKFDLSGLFPNGLPDMSSIGSIGDVMKMINSSKFGTLPVPDGQQFAGLAQLFTDKKDSQSVGQFQTQLGSLGGLNLASLMGMQPQQNSDDTK